MTEEIKKRIDCIRSGKELKEYNNYSVVSLPYGWDIKSIKELMSPVTEKTKEQSFEVLSITAGTGFVSQTDKFGKEIAGEQYKNYTVLHKGDFSYNKGNSKRYHQGCVYMLEDREVAAVPNVFNSFRIKNNRSNPQYYQHLFINGYLNKQLYKYINAGVRNDGLLNLYDNDFYSCLLPVPPIAEQQKIAEILTKCDKVIELKKQLIEEKKKQKKWLMQNLLNPDSGMRLSGFEESEWEYGTIRNLAKIKHGKSQSGVECANGKYPILASGGEIGRTDTFLYDKPSVLVGRKGSIDKPVYMDSPFWTVDTLFYSEISPTTNPRFVYYVFCSINWWKYNESTGVPSLSAKTVESIEVMFSTDFAEQTAIANVLSISDNEIELLTKDLNEWENKKKSLMQLLLTGIVRVKV